jgi:2-oxoglutarate ferredoxin oxidoreductase subunit delta
MGGRCKGCGFCIEFCPQNVLYQSTEINNKGYHIVAMKDSDKCTGCNICSMLCPEFAVSVSSVKEEPERKARVKNV